MKKVLALVFVVVFVFLLVGCNLAVGGNPTLNPSARYWGSLALESYDRLQYAWDVMTSDAADGYDKYYTVDPDGEWKVVYYLSKPNAWITPTTDIDEYLSKVKSPGIATYLFDTEAEHCDCGNHEIFMELPEEYYELQKHPYITIIKSSALDDAEIIDIDDASLLTYDGGDITAGQYVYDFTYDSTPVFKIKSCNALSQEALSDLAAQIVTLK